MKNRKIRGFTRSEVEQTCSISTNTFTGCQEQPPKQQEEPVAGGSEPVAADEEGQQQPESDPAPDPEQQPKKRCDKCNKKLGLTGGFPCRCGGTFCALHRYSDRHECSFDYRELGASEIRRDNPVIVASKLRKL